MILYYIYIYELVRLVYHHEVSGVGGSGEKIHCQVSKIAGAFFDSDGIPVAILCGTRLFPLVLSCYMKPSKCRFIHQNTSQPI